MLFSSTHSTFRTVASICAVLIEHFHTSKLEEKARPIRTTYFVLWRQRATGNTSSGKPLVSSHTVDDFSNRYPLFNAKATFSHRNTRHLTCHDLCVTCVGRHEPPRTSKRGLGESTRSLSFGTQHRRTRSLQLPSSRGAEYAAWILVVEKEKLHD